MSWFNSLGKMAKGVADFTGIAGLYHDLSTSMSNDDPWYVDSLNVAKDIGKIGTTPVRAAVKGVLAVGEKSYELGGVARQAITKGILDTPLMYNRFKNQDESYNDYKMRVEANKDQISLGQATLSLLSPGKNAGERSGFFQDWTENNLRFMSAGFDIFNADDRKAAFQDQYTGKFLSGMEDVVAYDYSKAVEILIERDGMDYSEAVEYMEFNVVGGYVGEFTPIFIETEF